MPINISFINQGEAEQEATVFMQGPFILVLFYIIAEGNQAHHISQMDIF